MFAQARRQTVADSMRRAARIEGVPHFHSAEDSAACIVIGCAIPIGDRVRHVDSEVRTKSPVLRARKICLSARPAERGGVGSSPNFGEWRVERARGQVERVSQRARVRACSAQASSPICWCSMSSKPSRR